jgi:hypothetical protein
MPRDLLSAASLAALAALAVPLPALAQVANPDLVIEGPIDAVDPEAKTVSIMGITVHVPSGTFDTPTRLDVPLAEMLKPTDGRPYGFVGGTGIATGGSADGVVTASNLFSDMNENVVVGEVTSKPGEPLAVNHLPLVPSPAGGAIPAAKIMNVFGFEIDPGTVAKGSLISVEGYLSADKDPKRLYFHTLEADTGTPKKAGSNEVSIVRTQCRDRTDRNKDELSVQGWVHRAGMPALAGSLPAVTISYPGIDARTRAKVTVSVTATLTIDPAAPQYAEYRYKSSNRNLDGCPLKVTVAWQGDTDVEISTVDAEAEGR